MFLLHVLFWDAVVVCNRVRTTKNGSLNKKLRNYEAHVLKIIKKLLRNFEAQIGKKIKKLRLGHFQEFLKKK